MFHFQFQFNFIMYTAWPRKNATLTINNFKKTRDRMKKLCALLRIKFFFQQDDTKIVNFDEGVLILEPFIWGNVIFKICTFCIKSHVWGREEFLWVAPPDSNAAKTSDVMNASLYSCWLCFTKQEQAIYPEKPNNGKLLVRKLWLLR